MLLEQLLAGLATTSVSGPDSALQTDISDVVYDSRKAVEGTLFVCMVGAETDGPMGFSRQEYWSELPFPSPGHLPNPGSKPRSPILQVDSLLSETPGKPI